MLLDSQRTATVVAADGPLEVVAISRYNLEIILRQDPDWLLHPAAGLVSTLGNSLGILRYKFGASRDRRIALTQALHKKNQPPT